ncbi:MAG: methionine adenosyltransferase [Myxococcota bacterium]
MNNREYLFSSESVTEGHPDKVADQISDAILDAIIKEDKNCRVACETLVTTGLAMIAGEITTSAWVDMPNIVRQTIKEIGYNDSSMGFDWETCAVVTSIDKQSLDIAMGVNGHGVYNKKDLGAGDQGIMFGYACDETDELMPLPIMLAHGLTRRLAEVRKSGKFEWLRPDGKSQVTVRYRGNEPIAVDAVVLAAQHSPEITHKRLEEALIEEVVKKVIPQRLIHKQTKYYVNATGRFVIGGPMGDCGVTGRKIIVDTYGGWGHHGGGCFSGKDPTKVDRSASYMARYIAKNIVAAGLASKVEVQLAYSIGIAHPISVYIDAFGTEKVSLKDIEAAVSKVFDMRPRAIIEHLNLLRPIYKKTAAYGHFGREEKEFTWEKTDRVSELRRFCKVK